MRQWVMILGFFIIVLIVIAGCTSTQRGATTRSNSQNPASGNVNSIIQCSQLPVDPIRFQKFLPNIPGYTPRYGLKISEGDNYINFTKKNNWSFINYISERYQISDKSTNNQIEVMFEDLGPCSGYFALDQNYVTMGLGRQYLSGGQKESYASNKINFHGYPATHATINTTAIFHDIVRIGVNNRLFVTITATGRYEEYSLSAADADIEKFANAIDFNGFAASVEPLI